MFYFIFFLLIGCVKPAQNTDTDTDSATVTIVEPNPRTVCWGCRDSVVPTPDGHR